MSSKNLRERQTEPQEEGHSSAAGLLSSRSGSCQKTWRENSSKSSMTVLLMCLATLDTRGLHNWGTI